MRQLKSNERSEAIELIKESQSLFAKNDFVFKDAGGEQSLGKNGNNDKRANTLFPDVLYYNDVYQNNVALGWELKMPNTDIDDNELFSNAVDKANRLRTNVFVLWNFKQAVIYCRNKENSWKENKKWEKLININTRDDVKKNRKLWKKRLKCVIIHLNKLFIDKVVTDVPVLQSAENISQDIAEIYSYELSDYYYQLGDRKLIANINKWYNKELMEFSANKPNRISDSEKTRAFAKNTLLNWINRITFANLLKNNHNAVNNALKTLLQSEKSFKVVRDNFNNATKISDFFTILNCQDIDICLSETSEMVIRQYNSFLYNKNFENIDQEEFQNTLESIINLSKRELMGLYTTPKKLATLLVNSTIENIHSQILDPCVGSGTIASSALKLLTNGGSITEAHENIWASDKYRLPLQVANISLSSKDSLNLPNQVFQNDLLSLKIGKQIEITNPKNGETIKKSIPEFDYIISNLPFIRNERVKNDTKEESRLKEINNYLHSKNIRKLELKHDWYQFGIIGIERLLKKHGTAAIITSNSWLKTKKKQNYINILFELFEVEKVITSSRGRWFKNAEVVTVILVLKKGVSLIKKNTKFIKINSDLDFLSNEDIKNISDSLLIDDIDEDKHLEYVEYTKDEIQTFIKNGLSLNILFQNIKWFNNIIDVTISMDTIFEGNRGTKSTNDKFFYDISDSEGIEKEYLLPILKSPANVQGFFAAADSNAFVVTEKRSNLKPGAQAYISKFDNNPKNESQRKLNEWYQFPTRIVGDFVTSINPEERLFWSSVSPDLLINQRLTVFKLKNKEIDRTIVHALLNTYFGQFMIEATGFGRGLGVLDTTKDGVLDSIMLDPKRLSIEAKSQIIDAWKNLSKKEVPKILDQLHNQEWIDFNKLVLEKYGKSELLNDIISALEKAVQMRLSVKK
ncbi:N-6 DNA methylase [Leptotrichia hongkongensis]|jgi:restriction endonuclease bseMII|uniref:site-specific DNA-methyltransferase (adenine-specific) n=1 Tax=Leptotrichia hongkongensis TaxID=554406 RepID=A0ABV4S848_9FUSO